MISRIAAAFVLVFYIAISSPQGFEFLGLGDVAEGELGRGALLGHGQLGMLQGEWWGLRLPGASPSASRCSD